MSKRSLVKTRLFILFQLNKYVRIKHVYIFIGRDKMSKKMINDLSREMESKIKIQFNEYAIKKYGCSELDLKMFHEDYNDAVIYYQKHNNRKIIGGTLLALAGICGTFIGLGSALYATTIAANTLASQISLLSSGATLSLSTGGISLRLHGILSNDMEYDLKKENPYILKGTIFQDMAEDYSKLRTKVKKKS